MVQGTKTSAVIKDVLADFAKLKGGDCLRLTRHNEVRPFDPGSEGWLETRMRLADCSLFALGSHSKKRPHNLVLGRAFDHQLLDMVELGVLRCKPLRAFAAQAGEARAESKPAFVFAGDGFTTRGDLAAVKSMLLDYFRGREVQHLNLSGLDRVVFVTHVPVSVARSLGLGRGSGSEAGAALGAAGRGEKHVFADMPNVPASIVAAAGGGEAHVVLLRQYSVRLKKSGTSLPRAALVEIGPSIDFETRRWRAAPLELERAAMVGPRRGPKKRKNERGDALLGKVGRIYVPRQDLGGVALAKPKGVKRQRRESAAAKQVQES